MSRWLLAVLALAVACKRAPPPKPPDPLAAALVNGQPIPVPLVQRELDRLRRGAPNEAPAPVEPKEVPQLARALLGPLIDRALLVQKAHAAGLSVGDVEVQAEIDRLSQSAEQGGESFDERLKKDGQTPDGLAEELRERLLAEKFVAQQLPQQPMTSADLKAQYDAHRSDFDQPEAVHALQIVVSSAEEAKNLLDQLRKGASFEELARGHSQSPDAKRGGDLGFFSRGTMPKVFDETCFSMKPGTLSGVVPSPYGFHLFKVLEKRAAHRRTFDEAKAELERRVLVERRAAAERALLDSLRASAQITINEAPLASLR